MKKFFISMMLVLVSFVLILFTDNSVYASNDSYYASVEGLTGSQLLNALADLTESKHTNFNSYDNLKTTLKLSDPDPNKSGYILDFYSGISTNTWNREHVWPKSKSGGLYGTSGAGSDIHHIRPTIETINSRRGSMPFTDFSVINKSYKEYTYDNKVVAYTDSTYWEPLDNVKGDTARILMYMYMHYSKEVSANSSFSKAGNLSIENVVYGGSGDNAEWNLLLYWNELDPVDAYERNRNEEATKVTGARNPFIDYPEFADAIWSNGSGIIPDDDYNEPTQPDNPETPDVPTTPEAPDTPLAGTTATRVDDVNELKVGDKIVVAATNYNYALSTTQNDNNRAVATITKSKDKISLTDEVQIITLTEGKKSNTFGFNVGNGYLYAASSGSNQLKVETTISDNSSWSISISGGIADVVAQGTNTRNKLRYNNNPTLFSCYSTGQFDISIYKVDSENHNKEVNELFNKYYDNGIYIKDTVINLNSAAQGELVEHFHAQVNILERTTYYKNDELWMSRGDGSYSYYGSNSLGLTYATTNTPNVTPYDSVVVVPETTMLDYYTTLETLKANEAVWKKEGNVYYTDDKTVLKYYLDFTAPCLLSSIFDSNYFIYEKATLEEVNGTLVLKLVIDSEMHNALSVTDNVLSQATIKVSDQSKMNKAKATLADIDTISIDKDYNLPNNVSGVEISWSGDNVVDSTLKYIKPTSNFTDVLTATLTIGNLTETITINIIQLAYVEIPNEFDEITIAKFLELKDTTKYYTLTGEVVSIVNTMYGNLTLKDSTGEIYVYGVLPEKDSSDNKNFAQLGINVGDTITIAGKYYYYEKDSLDEVKFAYLVSKDSTGSTNPDTPVEPEVPTTNEITLSFADKAYRTQFTSSVQVWETTGLKLTNNKASSQNNVADYVNPARFYAASEIIVEATNMTKIEFTCGSSSYATVLKNSIGSTATVSVSGSVVTVEFNSPVNSFTIKSLTAQVRINSMKVFTN